MDEEKPSEENAESQNDSENKETINEKENSSGENKEEISADSDNKEVIKVEESSVSDGIDDNKSANEEIKEESSNDESLINSSNESSEPVSEQSVEETPVKKVVPKSKEGKEGSWMPMIIVMGISLFIAFAWDKFDFISKPVHAVLDPTAGVLLTWNLTMGMLLIVLIINLSTTAIQKYATDQEALKELKKEQKILQEEMKKYKDHPEKVAELSKKQLQFIPKTFKLTSRAVMFTGIPFILFFRWFTDVFTAIEVTTGAPIRFLGFLSWFWFYLIFTMLFSTILRKMFKVV
ncbi:hypothetical protein KAT24_00755 [Candidatus Pacearchaeota archaeon]|nr:hypothetical protein [Candidatus Pacearchaeota archaeon]